MENLHPFSQFIRILGRGKKGSRSLTQAEAHEAMGMILDGHVEPEQLGAFLMLVRVKEETAEEVAGFVAAIRERIQLPGNLPVVDLDWSSYAGKRRQLPWFILAVMLLVGNGIKVFMHGLKGRKDDRVYTRPALEALGLPIADSLSDAAAQLQDNGFAYLELEQLCPRLQQLIDLRDLLGLRSPVHTVSRMLNPFSAPSLMQGIFHPGYQEIHQGAAALLGQPRMSVLKGEGGEIEYTPDKAIEVMSHIDGENSTAPWPALLNERALKDEAMDISRLKALWNGEIEDSYGKAAVIGTVAITLQMMGRADSSKAALAQAEAMWQKRANG